MVNKAARLRGQIGPAGRLVMAAALAMACVSAAPVRYTYAANGSGVIGGTEFFEARFTIVSTGLTESVYTALCADCHWVDSVLATIEIEGVGTAEFGEPTRNFLARAFSGVGFNSRIHYDLLDLTHTSLGGWDLVSNIGPIFYANPFPVAQFQDVATSLGPLSFFSYRDVVYQAEVEASVPEAGTGVLVCGGLGGLWVWGRRRIPVNNCLQGK